MGTLINSLLDKNKEYINNNGTQKLGCRAKDFEIKHMCNPSLKTPQEKRNKFLKGAMLLHPDKNRKCENEANNMLDLLTQSCDKKDDN